MFLTICIRLSIAKKKFIIKTERTSVRLAPLSGKKIRFSKGYVRAGNGGEFAAKLWSLFSVNDIFSKLAFF